MCEEENGIIIGETLRIKVNWSYPADPTKTLDNIDFQCIFMAKNKVVIRKIDMVQETSSSGTDWYAYVDSRELGYGMLKMELDAYIPDADAPSGVKTDISRFCFNQVIHA